jgi:hypothetical protein
MLHIIVTQIQVIPVLNLLDVLSPFSWAFWLEH